MIALGAVALAASVYLVYVLEILKFKSFRARELRQVDPDTSEHEIDQRVARELETGEFERVAAEPAEATPAPRPRTASPPSAASGRPR
jgi:UDP-GlcNAc:undecaprenyl-phosphate GlcNAc-1-phosphate transferase